MEYLISDRFDISKDYDKAMRYKIAIVRYNMGLNTFQRYISTTIASDVPTGPSPYSPGEPEHADRGGYGTEIRPQIRGQRVLFPILSVISVRSPPTNYEELKDTGDYDTTDVIGRPVSNSIWTAI